jgi:two-component system, NarL family, response regulator NreC
MLSLRNAMSIKVLLADDHQIIREGLRVLLENEPDIKIVGEAEDGRMTERLARELLPDVIIMDVAMPDVNGIEATRQIAAELTGVKIIALSMHDDRRFVLNMLKAGAAGYILKDDAFQNLSKAIRMVMHNKTCCSDKISGFAEHHGLSFSAALKSADRELLSSREREVLRHVAEGKTSNQIAENLSISVKTVETHRQQVMLKLNIKTIADLTKYAVREGLTIL